MYMDLYFVYDKFEVPYYYVVSDLILQNGSSIRDYEAEISKASDELATSRELVAKSEKILEERNQQISLLEKKLEAAAMYDGQASNERMIYQEEIEGLKSKVEEGQSEIAELNARLIEIQSVLQSQLSEKDSKIFELEREKTALERLRTEEVDNLQAHCDRLLQEQQEESKKRFDDTVAKLSEDYMQNIKDIKDKFESKVNEITNDVEKVKEAEIRHVQERFELEQRSQIQVVQEELTKAVSQKNVEETREVVREKDEQICLLEDQIRTRNEELVECQEMINKLENICAEKDKELNAATEKRESDLAEIERAKKELTNKLVEAEKRNDHLETILANSKIENEKFAKENDLLKEKFTGLLSEKEETENNFKNQVLSLKEDYDLRLESANMEVSNLKNSAEKDKVEFLQFVSDCGVLKEQLQKSIDNENALKKTIESLEREQAKSNDEMDAINKRRKEDSDEITKLRNETESLKEMLDRINNEKAEMCKENEAEIQMLKERLEVIKTENNNEMIDGFNQSMERLKQEKDEQIRNLKDEIAHAREGHDKYVQKMQADFESDLKHVEDENSQLKEQLKELKEVKDKEVFSIESSLKKELEAVKEEHGTEVNDLKMDIESKFEEEQLKLKEDHWHQLKRYEAEREQEIKLLVEEGEKRKAEEVELLRQHLEEEKHREIHDVVCNMTKDQKENIETLKRDMEQQLKKVQEDRDAELRNIKQEYKSFKEAKRQEMEDLVSSQMSKYQEEQETYKKRLNKAEGRIRKLTNEREEFLKNENRYKEELEDLKRKLADAEKKKELHMKEEQIEIEGKILQKEEHLLESKPHGHSQLMELFEDLRKEIHHLSGDGDQDSASSRLEDKGLGKSFDQSNLSEFEGSSVDKELSEITRLCKREIIDLAYKLKNMKHKYEDKEKEFSDLSFLNQTLKEDVERLEVELKTVQNDNEDAKRTQGPVFVEVDVSNKESLQKSFDIIDGNQQIKDLEHMNTKLQEVSAVVESKMKLKEELDASISDLRLELGRVKSEKGSKGPSVVEEVSAKSIQLEETMVVPEVLEELETLPVDESDGPEYVIKVNFFTILPV